jgi:hypothetical protein
MGKIYLETTDGKFIHMAITGSDIRTVMPPTSILNLNRCYSGTVQVAVSGYGTVTFDFNEPGRTGSCNQCGMCCGHPVADCSGGPHSPISCGYILNTDITWHVCQYLDIKNKNKWGDPNNSTCTIWANLLNTFKGCTTFPISAYKIKSWMTGCGFSF